MLVDFRDMVEQTLVPGLLYLLYLYQKDLESRCPSTLEASKAEVRKCESGAGGTSGSKSPGMLDSLFLLLSNDSCLCSGKEMMGKVLMTGSE